MPIIVYFWILFCGWNVSFLLREQIIKQSCAILKNILKKIGSQVKRDLSSHNFSPMHLFQKKKIMPKNVFLLSLNEITLFSRDYSNLFFYFGNWAFLKADLQVIKTYE